MGDDDDEEVILLDFWASMFGMRVKIALAEKGVEYERREVDLWKKSPLLLKMNPVYKKTPVLIHKGKPVCESLVIVEYIDEVWNERAPLLPSDPYQRAQARFWAYLVDRLQIYQLGRKTSLTKGAEQEAAKNELIQCLKVLEGELGDKPFFGGTTLGLVDIALIPYYSWFKAYESFGNFSIGAACPSLIAWAKSCLEKTSVFNSLADQDEVFKFGSQIRTKLGLE